MLSSALLGINSGLKGNIVTGQLHYDVHAFLSYYLVRSILLALTSGDIGCMDGRTYVKL